MLHRWLAYAITLPAAVAAALAALAGPPPDDDGHRRETAAAEHALMVAQLPLGERMAATISDGGLAAALARLGATLGVA